MLVVSGSRSDYGHLRPILSKLADLPTIKLSLVATASHFWRSSGMTIAEVRQDNFGEIIELPIPELDSSRFSTILHVAQILEQFPKILQREDPDWVLVLGDRYESLATALSSYILGVPVAHIHGGETSEGSLDEGFRHAITKFSELHFVAAHPYRDRVIQLGENPERVVLAGSPGLDALSGIEPIGIQSLLEPRNAGPLDCYVLVNYHPTTAAPEQDLVGLKSMLQALDRFPDVLKVVTGPNADFGSEDIRRELLSFCKSRPQAFQYFESLGHVRFLGLLAGASACVGNSSSGLIEAPALGVPTINIGSRQQGRLVSHSVVNVPPDEEKIVVALHKALRNRSHKAVDYSSIPYGGPGASEIIVGELLRRNPNKGERRKFFDLPTGLP